jgi:hypothetical protein
MWLHSLIGNHIVLRGINDSWLLTAAALGNGIDVLHSKEEKDLGKG